MTDDKLTDEDLDRLLAQMRAPASHPSDTWLARVTEDAETELQRRAIRPEPFWSQVKAALGGWQGVGGLAAACAVGLWLGFAPPSAIGDPVGAAFGGVEVVDLISDAAFDYDALLEEG